MAFHPNLATVRAGAHIDALGAVRLRLLPLAAMFYISETAISAALPRLRRDAIFGDLLAVRFMAPGKEARDYEIQAPTGSDSPLLDGLDALASLLPAPRRAPQSSGWRLNDCYTRPADRSIHFYYNPFAPGGQPGSRNTGWRPGDYNRSGLQRRFKNESRAPTLRGWVEYEDLGTGDWMLRLAPTYVEAAFVRLLRGRPISVWDFVTWALRYCPLPFTDPASALLWAREAVLDEFRIPADAVAHNEETAKRHSAWFYGDELPDPNWYLSEADIPAKALITMVANADQAAGGAPPDTFTDLLREATGESLDTREPQLPSILDGGVSPAELVVEEPPQADEAGLEVEAEADVQIARPFDPTRIRVEAKPLTLDLVLTRLKEGEIELQPGFQRKEVWRPDSQSRLIESILIRIPLPAFYFDATDDDRWLVVDGLQRLTALKKFYLDKTLVLYGLEFLELNGCGYDDLPRNLQRRISETQITAYLIESGTPPEVKFNIFKRINTGGLPLSSQEIRHALNQGPATKLLEDLAASTEFVTATGASVRSIRMEDRELVLRFLALAMAPRSSYTSQDLDTVLNEAMAQLNRVSADRRQDLDLRFRRAMIAAYSIFRRQTFRKFTYESQPRSPVNKALFEGWSVNLDRIGDGELQKLVARRDAVIRGSIALTREPSFFDSISLSTGDPKKVRLRDAAIRDLIGEVISD